MRFLIYPSISTLDNSNLTATTKTISGVFLLNASDSSGKHYFEVNRITNNSQLQVGICTAGALKIWKQLGYSGGCTAPDIGYVSTPAYTGTQPIRIMVAYDIDSGKIWFGAGGTWFNSGDPATGANPIYTTVSGNVVTPYALLGAVPMSVQFFVEPAQWLYAPSGFSSPTEFEPGVYWIKLPPPIDVTDGGAYQITGTVSELGVLGKYRVRLFNRRTGRLVREIWSGEDGTYAFRNIAYRLNGYFIVAYDHGDEPLNACIADLITPEIMP